MKLPFISRAEHEAALEDLRRRLVGEQIASINLKAELDRARELSQATQARGFVEPDMMAGRESFRYGRRLRVDMLIDDRVLLSLHAPELKEAIAEELAHKARRAVLSLDFALSRQIMEVPR